MVVARAAVVICRYGSGDVRGVAAAIMVRLRPMVFMCTTLLQRGNEIFLAGKLRNTHR